MLDNNREISTNEFKSLTVKLAGHSHLPSIQSAIEIAKTYQRKGQFALVRETFAGMDSYISVLSAKEADKIKRAALQYPS